MVVEQALGVHDLRKSDADELLMVVVTPSDESSIAPFSFWQAEDTSWFHSTFWQAMISESLRDLEEGRYETFDSLEDFLDSLPN